MEDGSREGSLAQSDDEGLNERPIRRPIRNEDEDNDHFSSDRSEKDEGEVIELSEDEQEQPKAPKAHRQSKKQRDAIAARNHAQPPPRRGRSRSRASSRGASTDEEMEEQAASRRNSLRSKSKERKIDEDSDASMASKGRRARSRSRGASTGHRTDEEIEADEKAKERRNSLRSSSVARSLHGDGSDSEHPNRSMHRRSRSLSRCGSRAPQTDEEKAAADARRATLRPSSRATSTIRSLNDDDEAAIRAESAARRMRTFPPPDLNGADADGESDSSTGNHSTTASTPAKRRRQSRASGAGDTPRADGTAEKKTRAQKTSASAATTLASPKRKQPAPSATTPSSHDTAGTKKRLGRQPKDASGPKIRNADDSERETSPRGRPRAAKSTTNGSARLPLTRTSTVDRLALYAAMHRTPVKTETPHSSGLSMGSSAVTMRMIAKKIGSPPSAQMPSSSRQQRACSPSGSLVSVQSTHSARMKPMNRSRSGKASPSAEPSRARRSSTIDLCTTDDDAVEEEQPCTRRGRPPTMRGAPANRSGRGSGSPSTSRKSSTTKAPAPPRARREHDFSPVVDVWARKKPNPPLRKAAASPARASTPRARMSSSDKRKDALRGRDEGLLKHFDLHYPGKIYCLARKGSVNEHGGKDFVQEIKDQANETIADWRKRAADMEKKGLDYEEDYIVGCAKFDGLWDEAERNMEVDILMKYGSFPKGYWMSYSTAEHAEQGLRAIQEFRWRQAILAQVQVAMRKECETRGEDFDEMYPEVCLKKVKKQMVDGYAMDKRAEQRTLIRAREATINACLKEVNLPPIILENWTGNTKDDKNIMDFVWTNYIHPSKKVERALAKADRTLTHRCNDECACNGDSEVSKACNCQKTKCSSAMQIANVECSTECKCTVESCASRVLQRGRQHPIVIIAHPVKGYTIRAAEFQASGEFVSEYAGEIITAYENAKIEQTYSTDLTDVIIDMEKPSNLAVHKKRLAKRGKKNKVVDDDDNEVDGHYHRAFVNSALKKGNESRYCSHHCRPNMAISVRYIERINFAFAHFGLFMTKDANIGDELTWNYHGETLEAARKKNEPFKSDLLPACDCKSPDCMIKPWSECTPSDAENGDADDGEPDYESFSEAEVELSAEEKKLKEMKERTDRIRKRREAKGEIISPKSSSNKDSSIENDTPPASPQ